MFLVWVHLKADSEGRTWTQIVYLRGNSVKQEYGDKPECGTRQESRDSQHEGVVLGDPTMANGDSVLPGLYGHHRVPHGTVCWQDAWLEHLPTSSHSPLTEHCPQVSTKALRGYVLEVGPCQQ